MAQNKAIKPRAMNGGITAPRSAAKGHATGIGGNRANPLPPSFGDTSARFRGGPGYIVNNNLGGMPSAQPPTAAAKAPTPHPFDAAYESSVNNADTRYNNTLLSLQAKKGLLQQEYGLDPGFNDYKVNPYSRASLLEQSYKRANRASGNSLAAAGQLYSGASQNAESYNREHNAQERNSLESLYRAALQQNSDEATAALNQREDEKNAALWKAIENATRAELEPETAPARAPGPIPALPAYLQGTPDSAKVKNKKTGKVSKIAVGKGRKA